jgi:hypothetical protein
MFSHLATATNNYKKMLLFSGILLGLFCINLGHTGAEAPAVNEVHDYCRQVLSGTARSACDRVDTSDKYSGSDYINIFHARNVASYQCRDKSAAQMEPCITAQAKKYIQQAASGSTSASKFESKLNSILSAANGSPNIPAAGSGALPAQTTGTPVDDGHTCGGDDSSVHTAINIGCHAKGNAVLDATFAIIRFLSNGVGLVLIGSLIFAGIQYTASNGNPQNIANAENRVKSVMVALLIYIFAYAMLNYLIPGKILQ